MEFVEDDYGRVDAVFAVRFGREDLEDCTCFCQEIACITTSADGTFTYSWKLAGSGVFMIRADAQGVKSSPVSIASSGGVPGFPLESLFVGSALGLLFLIVRRKQRFLATK